MGNLLLGWRLDFEVGEVAAVMEVIGGEDVDAAAGDGFEKVDVGMVGVVAAHAGKVAMGAEDGGSKFEFECDDVFGPRDGVEQASDEEFRPTHAVGQILV